MKIRFHTPSEAYNRLPEAKKQFVQQWIGAHLCPAKDGYLCTFDMRSVFKETGQYITPDEMQGALDAAGYKPIRGTGKWYEPVYTARVKSTRH